MQVVQAHVQERDGAWYVGQSGVQVYGVIVSLGADILSDGSRAPTAVAGILIIGYTV